MQFGVYQRAKRNPLFWLQHIDLIHEGGILLIYGGSDYEREKKTKYLHEGKYVAEVEVVLYDGETSWSPCLLY